MRLVLICLCCFTQLYSFSQNNITDSAYSLTNSLLKQIKPVYSNWVKNTAEKIKKENMEPAAITAYGSQQWKRSSLETASVETLVQMAMALAAADSEKDMKAMLAELNELKKRKQALRESQEKLKQPGVTKARLDSIYYSQNIKANTVHSKPVNVSARNKMEKTELTASELETAIKLFNNRSDSLADLSETMSLKIQMITDRYTKFYSALSNLMKKASDTSNGIIANMK